MRKKDNTRNHRKILDEIKQTGNRPIEEMATNWLEAIIGSADDAIISKTLEGVITSWNAGAERIFGYKPDEAIGKPIRMLIPQELQSEEDMILARIREGVRIEHYETTRLHKSGRPLDISLTISPIKANDGTIIGASKIARDITERKENEQRIKLQAEIVETINRVGQLLAGELDQQKIIQSVTDAATSLTGAQFGLLYFNLQHESGGREFVIKAQSATLPETFSLHTNPSIVPLLGNSTTLIGDVESTTDDAVFRSPGLKSYISVPLISRASGVIGGLFLGHAKPGAFTDKHARIVEGLAVQAAITIENARLFEKTQQSLAEREILLERERYARAQAEIASRSKDEFLGLLSHELRTPLNAILGWSKILISRPVDQATLKNGLEAIDRTARVQARLIEDMLDVSRIMSGKLRLDAQPVDLTTAVSTAVDTMRPAADAKGITFNLILAYGSGTVLGDPVRLQQIVGNLLSNAVKFTPRHGSVRISVERIDSTIVLTVSDTGPGIDEQLLPFVFDRFRQGDSSTTKGYGGLGLGLAIVRQLVELHGGTVKAANRPDGGAVFTVTLPVMPTRQAAISLREEPDFAHQTSLDSIKFLDASVDLNGIKILVVDDDADSRNLLEMLLKQYGAELATAESVPAALSMIEKFGPDVLVSDIGMPEEDGYSLIKKVRASNSRGRRLPAIALTAYARAEDRVQALSAGFNMHVPKPVELAELVTVIASVLDRN
jgi:PAS domain S-box-containing protein